MPTARRLTYLYRKTWVLTNQVRGYLDYFLSFIITILFFARGEFHDVARRTEIKNILVIHLGHLGEIVLTTAFLKVLRQSFPCAKVAIVGGHWALPILERSGLGDSYMTYDCTRYARQERVKFSLVQLASIFRTLRSEQFDMIVDLRSDIWISMMSVLIGARHRFDYGTTRVRKFLRHLTSGAAPWTPGHYLEQLMAVLDEMGIHRSVEFPEIFSANVNSLYGQRGRAQQSFVVLIHPFAEWPGREWPIANYIRLCQSLCDKRGVTAFVSGKQSERARVERIVSFVNGDIYNKAGAVSLRELPSFISKTSLFISSDGGAMHLAAALGVPVIAFFGPMSPEIFGPVCQSPAKVFYNRMPCSPCSQTTCSHDFKCMTSIIVEDVLESVETLIQLCKTN